MPLFGLNRERPCLFWAVSGKAHAPKPPSAMRPMPLFGGQPDPRCRSFGPSPCWRARGAIRAANVLVADSEDGGGRG